MKLHVTTFSQTSSHRAESGDRLAVTPLEDGGVLCVLADGVSAAREPGRCAERVVRLMADNFAARPRQWSRQTALVRLVEQANDSLYREGAYADGVPSMQTTLAAVCLEGNRLYGVNVGDSPVLLVRQGKTECLSHSHSTTNGDGMDILTNAVGMGPHLDPHCFETEIQKGDLVVVASDGLFEWMDKSSVGSSAEKSRSARSLVREALERAKSNETDDISTMVVEVETVDAAINTETSEHPLPKPKRDGVFDGFRLLRMLAGNSRVWLAEKDGARFVVKFVPEEVATDDSGMIASRFVREARNAVRLQGEFFVPARLPECGSPWYYIMDHLEAPSLRFFLKSRRLATDEAVELGKFLCRAGQFLLRNELVHADIKPENLLVFREAGEISFKLLDLGLAVPVFTDPGVSGTPSFLAPERFSGAAVTERTEIFSIGATLYEALTDCAPFGRIERFQTPHFGRVEKPSRRNPNVPPWLDGVILKCLNLKADKRYQCYSELLFGFDHPDKAPLALADEGPLLERNPLLFYRTGFWLLLILVLILLFKLLS